MASKAGKNKIAGRCRMCGNRVRKECGHVGSTGLIICNTCWNHMPESVKKNATG